MTAIIGKDFICLNIKNFGPAQDIRHEEALRSDDRRLRKKCQPFGQRYRSFVGVIRGGEMIDKTKALCLASVERLAGETKLSR